MLSHEIAKNAFFSSFFKGIIHPSGYTLFQNQKNILVFMFFSICLQIKFKKCHFFAIFQYGRDQTSNFISRHIILNIQPIVFTINPFFSIKIPYFHPAPKKSRRKTDHNHLAMHFARSDGFNAFLAHSN